MTVKELITELKKCNPDDVVMYDFNESSLEDASYVTIDGVLKKLDVHCSVDDVLIGSGTDKGLVYLTEEIL